MERVSIFLRTPLFSFGGAEDAVPQGVIVITGNLEDDGGAAIRIEAEELRDDRGRTLSDDSLTLYVPWEKIDHIVVFE